MKNKLTNEELQNALSQFSLKGEVKCCTPYGSGHINDTFLVEAGRSYILQRINSEIFKKPKELMENIDLVCRFMAEEIKKQGGNPERESLQIIPTKGGNLYYKDENSNFFRIYLFITDCKAFDLVEKPEHFYESAYAFGHFQKLLSDFPAEKLHETIPHFHDSPQRFQHFLKALAEHKFDRKKECAEEIEFFLAHEKDLTYAMDLLRKKELPLRVGHNDTKLNNVLFDTKTEKALCIIDLDTVMPGLAIFDFGDAIRFGANTGAEDETDLSKVSLSLPLFSLYTKGFLEACGSSLWEKEILSLPEGAKIMTLECGMRFLTDYLQGDTYFHVKRPEHNLDRARTQIALVRDMEKKWTEMKAEVQKYLP